MGNDIANSMYLAKRGHSDTGRYAPSGSTRLARRNKIPASVLGLNSRDPLDEMKPEYAIELTNFFPTEGQVVARRGYVVHAGAMGSDPVNSLLRYQAGATSKLYAVAGGNWYDVSPGQADLPTRAYPITTVGANTYTAMVKPRWRGTNFNGQAIFVNGVDPPKRIDSDGAFVAHGLTNSTEKDAPQATINHLSNVLAFKGRLYFTEKDTARLWYLAPLGIMGELSSFNLGETSPAGLLPQGGNIVALDSLSWDSGRGPDDYFCVIFENGYMAIYAGFDPTNADNWRLVGVFRIPRPVGDTPLVKYGGDLICITEDGFISLIAYAKGKADTGLRALSDLVQETVNADVRAHKGKAGFFSTFYDPGNMLIFNIPLEEDAQSLQYVMNAQTAAWCQFSGIPMLCSETLDGSLFFGGPGGTVFQFDVGREDNGNAIQCRAQTAFQDFKGLTKKQFHGIRPYIRAEGNIGLVISLSKDFQRETARQVFSLDAVEPSERARWGTFQWGQRLTVRRIREVDNWRDAPISGRSVSIALHCEIQNSTVAWSSTDVSYSPFRSFHE